MDSSSCLSSRNRGYRLSDMYFMVLGGESVSTNMIGHFDTVALRAINGCTLTTVITAKLMFALLTIITPLCEVQSTFSYNVCSVSLLLFTYVTIQSIIQC